MTVMPMLTGNGACCGNSVVGMDPGSNSIGNTARRNRKKMATAVTVVATVTMTVTVITRDGGGNY